MTQIAFWTSYSFLPPELSGNMGYWGILGSGAFVFIARHFAMVRLLPIVYSIRPPYSFLSPSY